MGPTIDSIEKQLLDLLVRNPTNLLKVLMNLLNMTQMTSTVANLNGVVAQPGARCRVRGAGRRGEGAGRADATGC